MIPTRIIIDFERVLGFNREALFGIAQAGQGYDNIFFDIRRSAKEPEAIKISEPAGVITVAYNEKDLERTLRWGVPCVNIANFLEGHASLPVIGNDDEAVGTMVAEFYINRGFSSFGYFCRYPSRYFDVRRESFFRAVKDAGFTCTTMPTLDGAKDDRLDASSPAVKWLASQTKPLALMAPFDEDARYAIQAAKIAELRVPEDVAVVGVDNDLNLCLTVWPQLSSVATAAAKVGQTALRTLMSMLQGDPPPSRPILFPPTEIVERGSTGDVAINDPDIAAAIHFMRSHLAQRLSVTRIADEVAVSRRTLERKFEEALKRTPLQELRRLRVDRARRLLASTDIEFKEVAKRSGFIYVQRLSNIFKAYTGYTPGKFRAEFGTVN